MKEIIIPIYTEEYKVVVVMGNVQELAKYAAKNCKGWDYERALEECQNNRGTTWLRLPARHPLITLDSDLPWQQGLATLAHEACHAIGAIMEHLGIKDEPGGEFMGHGVGAVIRHCIKYIKVKERI